MWEGDKQAILCAGIAAEYFNTDLSETRKKNPLTTEQKQGLHRNGLHFPQSFVQQEMFVLCVSKLWSAKKIFPIRNYTDLPHLPMTA